MAGGKEMEKDPELGRGSLHCSGYRVGLLYA